MAERDIQHPFPPPIRNVPVINPRFCAPYPANLLIFRRADEGHHGDFVVTDINTNVIFKLKDESNHHSLNSRRVLLDAAHRPIITLKPKTFSMHDRWEVFRGESTDDLLFTAKRSSLALFQKKTKLDVFLANNTEQKVFDFKVEGSWNERPCRIYARNSSSSVAEMPQNVGNVPQWRDQAMVTVSPGHDYGFIVALIIILAAINEQSGGGGHSSHIGGDGSYHGRTTLYNS